MNEGLESILADLPSETMSAALPDRIRSRLASYRRRETRLRFGIRAGSLALGGGSGLVLWPALQSLAREVVQGVEGAATPVATNLVADPGPTLWRMVEGATAWGTQVSFGLGATGVIALMALAVPALLGLTWTLGGRKEEARA
jgi:hypothetical protein